MIDFAKQLVHEHFTALLVAIGIVAAVILVLCIVLFRELMVHYDRTRKAMQRFVEFVGGLRRASKGDPDASDDLAKTISQPQKAIPNPRTSGEKKP